ncbi:hypothetical protein [Curtobacterium sp. RRHDQ10]|uniref:hypothetical protein n=1 Tax=Curtobacterium phyllosphaerae TaxID=3413379 RepID=UPI003BF29A6D
MTDQQPYRGRAAGGDPQHYGGVPYQPPERVQHHERATEPLRTGGIVWRVVLSVLLGVLGVAALVRVVLTVVAMVILAWHPDAGVGWGGLWGSLVASVFLAGALLFWPVANLVALVRSRGRSTVR